FLALGLLVFPSQLGSVLVEGTLLALIIAFLARPVAAALATAFERFNARTPDPWLGRAARGAAGIPCDLPGNRRCSAQPRILQYRVLRCSGLDPRPGCDSRPARKVAGHREGQAQTGV